MLQRWAITGKEAPNVLPNQMMKRDAMRRPLKVVAPPPEPQLTLDDMVGRKDEMGETVVDLDTPFWQEEL
jgi:hypothetical protein